jgi:hypothetical protein
MDIHKPKPWHGIREFLKEYLIIAVGVLTALAAEQMVVAAHERRIADEARESVRAEVRENLWWLERREVRQPCVRQKLTEVRAVLDLARHGQAYPVPQQVRISGHIKVTSLRWEANAQAGRASLFTTQEQRTLGNMYFTTEEFHHAESVEEEDWSKLRAMEGLDRLTPAEIDTFAILLAQASYQEDRIELSLQRAHEWAATMGLKAANPSVFAMPLPSATPPPCTSISTPRSAS